MISRFEEAHNPPVHGAPDGGVLVGDHDVGGDAAADAGRRLRRPTLQHQQSGVSARLRHLPQLGTRPRLSLQTTS